MSRIRSIHPGFFTDEDMVQISVLARLAVLFLATEANIWTDIVTDSVGVLANRFGASAAEFSDALSELEAIGAIQRVPDGWILRHNLGHPRRRIRKWDRLRKQVFERDGWKCQYCGSTEQPLHCDHVTPVSRGGTDDLSNLTTACRSCNLSKHDLLIEEWLLA